MKLIDEFENHVLPIFIAKLFKNFQKTYDEILKPYGLSKFHAFYLICLSKYSNGLKLNELNDIIGCDKANTSRAITDLGNKGIIFRDVGSINEKKFVVKLTEKGFDIARSFCLKSKSYSDSLIDNLSNEEQIEFFRLISKMINIGEDNDTSKEYC